MVIKVVTTVHRFGLAQWDSKHRLISIPIHWLYLMNTDDHFFWIRMHPFYFKWNRKLSHLAGVIVPTFDNGTWFVLHQIFVNPLEPGPGHLRFKKDLTVSEILLVTSAMLRCHTFLEPAVKWSALGQALQPWDPWRTVDSSINMGESSGGRKPVTFHILVKEADDLSPPLLFIMVTANITILTG